jgi:hypothetical protein
LNEFSHHRPAKAARGAGDEYDFLVGHREILGSNAAGFNSIIRTPAGLLAGLNNSLTIAAMLVISEVTEMEEI